MTAFLWAMGMNNNFLAQFLKPYQLMKFQFYVPPGVVNHIPMTQFIHFAKILFSKKVLNIFVSMIKRVILSIYHLFCDRNIFGQNYVFNYIFYINGPFSGELLHIRPYKLIFICVTV